MSEGADRLRIAAPSLQPGEALQRALNEDRKQREVRQMRFNRRVRAVWRIYGWMNWAFPLGVLGLTFVLVRHSLPNWTSENFYDSWEVLAILGLVSLSVSFAVWWCIRDWVGRALLSLFLDAARREEIGLIAPEAVASEGI